MFNQIFVRPSGQSLTAAAEAFRDETRRIEKAGIRAFGFFGGFILLLVTWGAVYHLAISQEDKLMGLTVPLLMVAFLVFGPIGGWLLWKAVSFRKKSSPLVFVLATAVSKRSQKVRSAEFTAHQTAVPSAGQDDWTWISHDPPQRFLINFARQDSFRPADIVQRQNACFSALTPEASYTFWLFRCPYGHYLFDLKKTQMP